MNATPAPDATPTTSGAGQSVTPDRPTVGQRANSLVKKIVVVLVAVALVVIAYFILEAFLPRWWAGQIGRRVDGSFSSGVGIGLLLGFACTFIPVGLIALAISLGGRWKRIPSILCAVLAVVVAVPNLLTLAVVVGRGNGSHAGQRIFDVQAPGFRAASLWGAVAGAVVGLLIILFVWRYRRRGRQLRESRAHAKDMESIVGVDTTGPPSTGTTRPPSTDITHPPT